jgi:RHS repeat-associated protein
MLANYEYSPFGETIRCTGALAKNNPFRFSSKYDDDESDFLYYGYRYYKASAGTWISRDPTQEDGGLNLYSFAANDLLNSVDLLGNNSSSAVSGSGGLGIQLLNAAHGMGFQGAAYMKIKWLVPEGATGYVIQHVTIHSNIRYCKTGTRVITPNNEEIDYLEAWTVVGGKMFNDKGRQDDTDVFQTADEDYDTYGIITVVGRAKFWPSGTYSLTIPPWKHGGVEEARNMLTLHPVPSSWDDSGARLHAMYVIYSTCCHYYEYVAGVPTK